MRPNLGLQPDQLRAFLKVAETRSFSSAAEELGLTRSGLSKLIGRLEDDLGVQLFNRSTRSVALTAIGESFLPGCKRLLSISHDIETDIRRRSNSKAGLVKMNVSSGLGRTTVIPALPDLFREYPELRIDLRLTDEFDNLIESERDLAVCFGGLPDTELKRTVLARTMRVTCAAPSYVEEHGMPESIADLRHHRCLSMTGWAENLNWSFRRQREFDGLRLVPFMQVNSIDALRSATLAGLGIAQCSSLMFNVDLIRSGKLIQILPDELVAGENVSVLYPGARFRNPLTQIVVDFLKDVIGRRAEIHRWEPDDPAPAPGRQSTANGSGH